MGFLHPLILIAAVPFLLLLLMLKKLEKRRYRDIPTVLIMKEIGGIKLFAKKCGKAFWIFAAILIIIALARPQSTGETEKLNIEGRMMILSVDLSMSMSGTSRSETGRPAVDVIKELSDKFVEKRASTDLVGITAYGSEATVIVFPTSEYAQLKASIQVLQPRLLGVFTSIGEGIFISILSLMEPDVIREIKKENPDYINDLRRSIESGDQTFALNLVRKLGRFRNKIIVLFTDGKNNRGMEPRYPLWLCKALGIKVYFGALESTAATGLSEEEEVRQKNLLIDGLLQTGGRYYEMEIAEQSREFYEEIDRLETATLEFENFEVKKDIYFWPVFLALITVGLIVILENIFPRIQ